MSLETQLQGIWDRAKSLSQHIEAARNQHFADQMHLVGFEVGSALGELHLLEQDLIKLAEEHFYDK